MGWDGMGWLSLEGAIYRAPTVLIIFHISPLILTVPPILTLLPILTLPVGAPAVDSAVCFSGI